MLMNLAYITIFGVIWGGLILISYRAGYLDGKEILGGKRKTDAIEGKRLFSEEKKRINKILRNIDNYDGTELGQKEI